MTHNTRPRTPRRTALVAAVALCGPAWAPAAAQDTADADGAPVPTPAELGALYQGGAAYDAFLDAARSRRALWEGNTKRAVVPAALLDRARAVPGRWRLLAVAVDRCSDSVNTIPYIAALAEAVPDLGLRIVDPDDGRAVMEAWRTPDGRAATPTVVLLDEAGRPVGAWVERPSSLQTWITDNPEGLSHDDLYDRKMAWYRDEAGLETLAEIVALLETATR
jgi:hypothetical protein